MSFPQTPLENFTELQISSVWTDVTKDVLIRDDSGRVIITRGIQTESSGRASAGTMDLSLRNSASKYTGAIGRYCDQNPVSDLYGLIGRNTQIRHSRRYAYDAYGRTTAAGWGTADSGQTWSTNGGAAANYSTGSGVGSISNASVNVIREVFLTGFSLLDCTVAATLKPGVVATGAPIQMALEARRADASNYYYGIAAFDPAGTVAPIIGARVAGVNTAIGSTADTIPYGAGTQIRMELDVTGGILICRMWDLANPSVVLRTHADDSSVVVAAAGSVACRSILVTGNTNVTPAVTFDDLVVQDIRFAGEVPQWPQRWDITGTDVWAPIQAAGLLRRLQQGTRRLQSVMTRAIPSDGPLEFWPCEDGSGAVQAANLVADGAALRSYGATPTFGTTLVAGAAGGFTLGADTGFRAAVRASTATTLSAEFLINVAAAPASAARMIAFEMAGGTYPLWTLTVFPGAGVDTWGVEVFDNSGVRQVLNTTTFSTDGVTEAYGMNLLVMLDMRQNGGNTEFEYRIYDYLARVSTGGTGSYAGTLGRFNQAVVPNAGGVGIGSGTKYSQISLWGKSTTFATWSSATSYVHTDFLDGFNNEDPVARLMRLADENGIALATQGDSSPRGIKMGPQGVDTLYNVMLECADVDQGVLYETRTQLGLTYRACSSLYNQTAVSLDYATNQLAGDLQPTSDDQIIRNTVTVARKNGSSALAVQSTGDLNVQEPPAGVGQYDRGTTTVNCAEDVFAPALVAQWLRTLGTINEPRYPGVQVALSRAPFTASAALLQGVAGLDTGDLIKIANPPVWLPPWDIEALVLGYREEMWQYGWTLRYATRPGSPYDVIILDSAVGNQGRLDSDASTLNGAHTSGTTSLSVATTANHPLWTTAAGDVPFDIEIAGERITVTVVAGAASPQTFTVTRSVNSVVKAQASGATVRLWRPSVLGF